jgi:uncharacterized protein YdcH (DUF465 family)
MVHPDMITGADRWTTRNTYPPVWDNLKARKVAVMEKTTQEELKAHLIATNEEFRSLANKHAQYHRQLEELEAKSHLTLEDEAEEQRLKKQKLRLKDQMNEILSRYKAQQVA